ncbi:S-layer homology domain-containing protein [bacterium]|nr:S-layer homology domain-containing protein [bacterium]
MKKNLLKTALTLLTSLMITIPAFAYPDVAPNHWAAKQIEILTEQGVIVGYPDGTFQPDENVTRAEFASMAIKALGQEHTTVAQPVNFTDIDPTFWAYDAIQKALYFDLISCPPEGDVFRPDDTVTRAESISVAVNALTTEQISESKAKEVLSKTFTDINEVPQWFIVPAGKAEILNMLVTIPSANSKRIEASRPATRAEVAAILYNMMEQAKLNPNAKLAEAMRKKTGEGFVVENAFVQGSYGTIPAGSIVPIQLSNYASSQSSQAGEIYVASAAENYITKDKFILVRKGANLKGQLLDVRNGKWFVRNGVLVLDNSLITTTNDQTVSFNGVCEITKDRNWFMKFVRFVFKGEKLDVSPENTIYLKLLKPIKVDLTNGWIIE